MIRLPTGRPRGKEPGERGHGWGGRPLGRAYQGALEAVLAVVVGGGAGAWADARFGTSPLLLLVGLALGFATFVLRLTRLLRELTPPADREE